MRIFRIESYPDMYEDEQQDGFLPISLVDLVKHMHPYSLRVAVDKKERLRDVEELLEEDVFVDVVGDDDTEESSLGMPVASTPSDMGSEQIVSHSQSPEVSSPVHNSKMCLEDALILSSPKCGEQEEEDTADSVLAKAGSSGRRKKKVRFALDLASIHIYQVEDEAHEGDVSDTLSSADNIDDLRMAGSDSPSFALSGNSAKEAKEMPTQNGNTKLKTLSLQEYRLLRQKTLPKEERKRDYKTKWPSVPETPKELPPILFIPGYNSQVNVQTSSSNAKAPTPRAVTQPRKNLHLPQKSVPKQTLLIRKPVQAIDPPNPATVSLQPVAKILPPVSETVMQKEVNNSQANQRNVKLPALVQHPDIRKQHPRGSLTISGIGKSNISDPASTLTAIPMKLSQKSLPRVQIPVTDHCADKKRQESTGEIGNFNQLCATNNYPRHSGLISSHKYKLYILEQMYI